MRPAAPVGSVGNLEALWDLLYLVVSSNLDEVLARTGVFLPQIAKNYHSGASAAEYSWDVESHLLFLCYFSSTNFKFPLERGRGKERANLNLEKKVEATMIADKTAVATLLLCDPETDLRDAPAYTESEDLRPEYFVDEPRMNGRTIWNSSNNT